MFDTMTMTKILGALCGMLLIFLLGNWAASSLYRVGSEGHGEEAMAYEIETDDEESGEPATGESTGDAGDSNFEEVFAMADPAKGESGFTKCKACHKLEAGAKGVGPSLFGIVGRDIGSVDGFKYTGILTELPGDWTPQALDGFLENPKAYAAGTKMTFKGLAKPEDRANLIAYLATIGG